MKTLFLDMKAGVASDMLVGALLDLGADEAPIARALASFNKKGIADLSYEIKRVNKKGVEACDFKVKVEGDDSLVKRNLEDMQEIINELDLSDIARRIVLRIYDILAGAEGTIYRSEPNQLYFHETSSMAKLADIVAFAACFDSLIVGDVYISKIGEGHGQVEASGGRLNVPVPEVKLIADFYNIPIDTTDKEGELITPSGIAMVVSVTTTTKKLEHFKIVKTGIGAGKMDFDWPAVLEAHIVERI